MKICLISFDYWDFDKHIVDSLNTRNGVEAVHINLFTKFKYKHPGFLSRVKSFFLKTFLNRNVKKIAQHKHIQQLPLNILKHIGKQDIILVIRPDVLDTETHIVIKQYTDRYYAYLYDSTKRFAIHHLPQDLFDKVFSFDKEDVQKYNYIPLSNYIYLSKKALQPYQDFKYKAFIVASADERLKTLNKIAERMKELQLSAKFIVQGDKEIKGLHENIEYTRKEIRKEQLTQYMDESQVFIDLVRHGHNGLSFRVFEALAYQKKLITTNKSVKDYDFYNPDNIHIIETDTIDIPESFFKTPYTPLPEDVYNKYTTDSWVNNVFFK